MNRLMLVFVLLMAAVGCAETKSFNKGPIKVAMVLDQGATIIDFAGPMEVFQDVMLNPDGSAIRDGYHHEMISPFEIYTVSEKKELIQTSSGMKVMPDYTYADAPQPQIVLIPAQGGKGEARLEWLKKVSGKADYMVSVCTGAFILAKTGLLDGKSASTHHWFNERFEKMYPNVKLEKGVRFVDNGKVLTAGGLTSGMDLALHIVERYYGRDVAQATAEYMEYQSDGWKSGGVKGTAVAGK
jgi:transcriptional regulator GlxA family with amidase domain